MQNRAIDPLIGPKYALEGKVVTMDDNYNVLNRGVVYIDKGQIVDVKPTDAPCPAGFENCLMIRTGGTIYPGLIELHNHLSYNVLPLWNVPEKYSNRSRWGGKPEYRKLISGPMHVLGRTDGYVEAIVRYVECKCLLSGVTTSQGIALYSNQGIRKYYRGIVRNVEETDEVSLPEAKTKISDVDASKAEKFLERLQKSSCLLLHLSEGVDQNAYQHFKALQLNSGDWAITPALSGIHAVALEDQDFRIMKEHGGSMVWSPLSNLMLYGNTADIKEAKDNGMLIGIGSDWSPTGSKNLLGELKIAKMFSEQFNDIFSDQEILAMATRNAAKILKWDEVLGTIEKNKRADLMIIYGRKQDPYERLFKSKESSIIMVVINGIPRFGQARLMKRFGVETENWRVGRSQRILNLHQETADPVVGELTLREAKDRLSEGMQKLPELAQALEAPRMASECRTLESAEAEWYLVLDHNELEGEAQRPHLPFGETRTPTGLIPGPVARVPLSQVLIPLELDDLTVSDDGQFVDRLIQQQNLPVFIKSRLADFY
jgi:cytosine/adenosine deaminase-related metal-dependent hydrolase